MQFYLSLFAAIGAAISLVLHALAPKYPTAGKIAGYVDQAEQLAGQASPQAPAAPKQ